MKKVFSIDLRTLALFRVMIGLVILADLVNLWPHISVFFSDYGTMPRAEAMIFNAKARWSLHFLSGEPLVIQAVFVFHGLVALALIFGYRTRVMTILAWVLVLSLKNRNLFIQQGGDQLLSLLLFWSMFLPLGARYSIDFALRPKDTPLESERHFSPATISILLQAIYVYFIGALLKDGGAWMPEGQAVYYAVHLDSLATSIAQFFRPYGWLLQGLTYFVWTIELLAPFLMFTPWFFTPARLIALFLLISMHLGFVAFLTIGLFPAVSICSLILFTPPAVWDWLAGKRDLARIRQIILFYDEGCGFCEKTCRILRAFCLTPENAIRPAQSDAQAGPVLQRYTSWVVRDANGTMHVKWAAVVFVLKQSPITWVFGWIAGLWPFSRFGDAIYDFIGRKRQSLGRFSARWLKDRAPFITLPRWQGAAVSLLLVFVAAWNVVSLPNVTYEMPRLAQHFAQFLRLDQRWDMFAPYPLRVDGHFVIRGEFTDGSPIDLWTGRIGEPDRAKPAYHPAWFGEYRWRKYFERFISDDFRRQRHNLARYYCRLYSRYQPTTLPLAKIEITFYREITQADYAPKQRDTVTLLRWNCLA